MTHGQDKRDDDARFEALIERSSLGAPGPRQLRARIPLAEARGILASQAGQRVLSERTVKVLVVGHVGSGKTLMLASLYHHYAHGTPEGIQFTTDDESHGKLTQLVNEIRDPGRPLPSGTSGPAQCKFAVQVESRGGKAEAFTLEYLDYTGDWMPGSSDPSSADEPDQEFKTGLEAPDILLGVLDGEQFARLMNCGDDAGAADDVEHLLNTLARIGHRNIHLVITKWDAMRDPNGGRYTVSQVLRKLERDSRAFERFRRSTRGKTSMRIIPVSALGLEFACPTTDSGLAGRPGVAWTPWNVEIPFLAAIPDILAADASRLDDRRVHPSALRKISLAVFSLVKGTRGGASAPFNEGTIPAGQMIGRVKKAVGRRNQRGVPPAALTPDTALSYVVNESYAALKEFEEITPGSRVLSTGYS
jgi:hypothetical protein